MAEWSAEELLARAAQARDAEKAAAELLRINVAQSQQIKKWGQDYYPAAEIIDGSWLSPEPRMKAIAAEIVKYAGPTDGPLGWLVESPEGNGGWILEHRLLALREVSLFSRASEKAKARQENAEMREWNERQVRTYANGLRDGRRAQLIFETWVYEPGVTEETSHRVREFAIWNVFGGDPVVYHRASHSASSKLEETLIEWFKVRV